MIRWGDRDLALRGDGSVYAPHCDTLFVADVHLGKGAVFRARGVPVPSGDSAEDLHRLSGALRSTGATRLVVLGDLAHGPGSFDVHVRDAMTTWRAKHAEVHVLIVRGNHDRSAGDPPPELGFEVRAEPVEVEGYVARHHPPEEVEADEDADDGPARAAGRLSLVGHLHPVARLEGGADRARLPCFWLRSAVLVLPAWGRFTGGYAVRPIGRDRVFVPAGGHVIEVGIGRPLAGR